MKRYVSENGVEVPAITAEQMREIDRIAVEEIGPNLYQMIENAGRNLSLLSMALLDKGWDKAKIIVLAGTGGNGGGGICAARHLANREADVTLCLSHPDKLSGIPFSQFKTYGNTEGKWVQCNELVQDKFDLVVDALIGYSLKGVPTRVISELIQWANQAKTPILSLDVPSGVDAATGETPGDFIHANRTMTLALPKTGLLPEKTGELYLADIGIPQKTYGKIGIQYSSPFGKDDTVRLRKPS